MRATVDGTDTKRRARNEGPHGEASATAVAFAVAFNAESRFINRLSTVPGVQLDACQIQLCTGRGGQASASAVHGPGWATRGGYASCPCRAVGRRFDVRAAHDSTCRTSIPQSRTPIQASGCGGTMPGLGRAGRRGSGCPDERYAKPPRTELERTDTKRRQARNVAKRVPETAVAQWSERNEVPHGEASTPWLLTEAGRREGRRAPKVRYRGLMRCRPPCR